LWLEAGCPNGDGVEFWIESEEAHKGYWLPYDNGYIPTPQEVNDWNILTMGHDSINSWICVSARLKREGIADNRKFCRKCKGDGSTWMQEGAEEEAEKWESEEPPTGEGYQIWETVSEGSPISPVFADPVELANWMADENNLFGADEGTSADTWLKFILGPGWAPSAVGVGEQLMTGVQAVVL